MENFMERLYRENSPENKKKEEEQRRKDLITEYVINVCIEIKEQIRYSWNDHVIEGYITCIHYDGISIGFEKKLKKISKKYSAKWTYWDYLKIESEKDADSFIKQLKDRLVADGIKNLSVRKEKVSIESFNPDSVLKLIKKKLHDAYVFYIIVKW